MILSTKKMVIFGFLIAKNAFFGFFKQIFRNFRPLKGLTMFTECRFLSQVVASTKIFKEATYKNLGKNQSIYVE